MKVFSRLFKRSKPAKAGETTGEAAGRLFDGGMNCAQAVLQATTGRNDPELMAMAEAFGGGIDGSRCLCGAVAGGVMALGLRGQPKAAGDLVAAFKERNRATCCRSLSAPYRWNSREHRANCRRITMETADLIGRMMKR